MVTRKIKKCGDIVGDYTYTKGYKKDFRRTNGLLKVEEEGKNKYFRVDENGEMFQVKIGRQNEANEEQQIENRIKNLNRARNNIKDLINSNAYAWKDNNGRTIRPKFLTLTYGNDLHFDIKNVEQSNKEFKKFIQRLNRYIKKNIDSEYIGVQYVAIIEFQDTNGRGAIHYHILLFNMPFIPWKVLMDKWKLGGAYIEGFKDKNGDIVKMEYNDENDCFMANDRRVENVGAYITKTMKYMEKSLDDERLKGKKCYMPSGNLKKPIVYTDADNEKEIEQMGSALSLENLVFINSFENEHIGQCDYFEYNTKFKHSVTSIIARVNKI